jgi:hypothetical protein
MAGFLQRLVQRGLGRTRTVRPLYTARYARDAAPAVSPARDFGRGATIRRQGENSEREESENLARQSEEQESDEDGAAGDVARSPAGEAAAEGDGEANAPLMRQKPERVDRRPVIHRQADEEGGEEAVSGDGGGDPGGSDEGLASEAGTQSGVPEDEDLAPGRGDDTLSPKILRRGYSKQLSTPRLFRQAESEENAAPRASAGDAGNGEDESLQTSRDATISRRAAPGPARGRPSRNISRQTPGAAQSAARESQSAVFEASAADPFPELLMPPNAAHRPPASAFEAGVDVAGDAAPATNNANGRPGNGALIVESRGPGFARTPPGRPPAPPRRESGSVAGPDIQISIGRIEIRAVGDGAQAAPPPASYPAESSPIGKMQSLDEYLKRRNGEVQ